MVERPLRLLNLKQKIGYNKINDDADERLAGNRSFQALEAWVATEEVLAGKCCIPMMEVDTSREREW